MPRVALGRRVGAFFRWTCRVGSFGPADRPPKLNDALAARRGPPLHQSRQKAPRGPPLRKRASGRPSTGTDGSAFGLLTSISAQWPTRKAAVKDRRSRFAN
jgi:hypothetical protein